GVGPGVALVGVVEADRRRRGVVADHGVREAVDTVRRVARVEAAEVGVEAPRGPGVVDEGRRVRGDGGGGDGEGPAVGGRGGRRVEGWGAGRGGGSGPFLTASAEVEVGAASTATRKTNPHRSRGIWQLYATQGKTAVGGVTWNAVKTARKATPS